MKQHLYEPALFLRSGQEWIKGFTMERPMQQLNEYNLPFAKKMKKFLASAVEYPVCEGSKEEIKDCLRMKGRLDWIYLNQSESIDELADRLEVVDVSPVVHYHDYQIRLRPEVKEESQDEIIDSFLEIVKNYERSHDPADYWSDTIRLMKKELKQQFKITRK